MGGRGLCQRWWVELELLVGYANEDVPGSLGYDTLICKRWFRGCEVNFRVTCTVGKGEIMTTGVIFKEDCVGT